ncbi:MAG: hypothetical protein IKK21_00425 [Clostridia bacterium]|nr:hypothetical protein [Clostridia bacterium]
MPEKVYEIIALAARYWFALLGVVIVWQSFTWLRRDRREKHRRLKHLPDAGMIGEMVVMEGSDELPEGTSIPIPREGTLGFLRTCDVCVPVAGVAGQHCDFTFVPGKGLMIFPRARQFALVDEEMIRRRKDGKRYAMHHGSRLQVGEAVLRLRVFMGLEVDRYSTMMTDEEQQLPQETVPWQESPYIYHQVPAAWNEQTGEYTPVQPYDPYAPQQGYPPPCGYPPQPVYPPYDPQAAYPPQQPYAPEEFYSPAEPLREPLSVEEPAPRRRRRFGRRADNDEA